MTRSTDYQKEKVGAIVASDDLVYLRRVSKDDFNCYYRWYKNPEIQRYMANPYWDPDRSKDSYRNTFLRLYLLETGTTKTLTVCLKDDNSPVGFVIFFDIDRHQSCCELGIVIGERDRWRQGIGSSALRLVISHILDTVGLSLIYCNIVPENIPSIRLFEKCGFVFQKTVLESGKELLRYELRRQ